MGDLTYYLSQYDFEVKYSPGRNNVEADCLSRNPVLEPEENEDEILRIVNLIKFEEIENDQKENENLKTAQRNIYQKNNIYYKKTKDRSKIILSEDFSKSLIKKVHQHFCHMGMAQLHKKIGKFYTAKNLYNNIKDTCKNCEICIKNKSRINMNLGLMSYLGPATKPFEICSIDTIGGFGGSRSTKRYLHLLVDHFTRYAFIATSKTQHANDFIKLVDDITQNNTINKILTDQYPGINSQEFKSYLKKKNIELIFTAVNAPFSNGLNERLNQTLVNKIRCKINETDKKIAWTTIARECTQKYNETEHTVTGFAPAYLLEGKDVSILPKELNKSNMVNTLQRDRETALKNSIKSHNYNKQLFDKNRKKHQFKIGDLIYIENGNKLNRKKLDEIRIGPYKIIDKLSDSIFKIDTGRRKQESNLFHVTKMLPASGVT